MDEVVGGDAESYEVYVCASADEGGDCANGGAPIFAADMGGTASGSVGGG